MQASSSDAGRMERCKLLLAKLQAATSVPEEDDVHAMLELDAMKRWMVGELGAAVCCGSTYEAASAELHRFALSCAITATHLLRLWANRPCVLQGSSAAPRLTTAVVQNYIGFPWAGDSCAKVRRYALTPGFVSAYAAACQALAAALDKASAADVPSHIAETTLVLLWLWRAAMESFDGAAALGDTVVRSQVLPVAQLAGAALRCWAGPTAASSSRAGSASNAMSAAVDVAVMLAKAAAEICHCEEVMRNRLYGVCNTLSSSHDLQWLLCCYVGLVAQVVHKQQNGKQRPLVPAAGSSWPQQQQQQQQQPAKVAAVHKRLLEGLRVPGLIGWQYTGHTSEQLWQDPKATVAVCACADFSIDLAHPDPDMDLSSSGGGGSSRASMQQQLAAAAEAAAAAAHDPPLLTATVHLRRAAVLLELCLLQPNSCTYFIVIGCIQQSMTCMFRCLRAESSSDAAAWDRVYAAIGNGILPAVLQQLLPVLPLLMQQAEQASGATGGGSVAQGLAMLLSTVVAGTHIPGAQLIDALQQPSSAAALESCVRCWAHQLVVDPAQLPPSQQDWMLVQRLAGILASNVACTAEAATASFDAVAASAGAAAAAAATPEAGEMLQSAECFALCVSCLKVMQSAATAANAAGAAAAAGAQQSVLSLGSSAHSWLSLDAAFTRVTTIVELAAHACRSLSSSSSSSSSRVVPMLRAWQLLLAHSLHAAGSMLLAVHTEGLLPAAPPQQQQQQQAGSAAASSDQGAAGVPLRDHPQAMDAVRCLSSAVAGLGPQLTAMQGTAALPATAAASAAVPAAGSQGSSRKGNAWLMQQHEELSRRFAQLVAAADTLIIISHSEEQLAQFLFGEAFGRESLKELLSLRSAVPAELAQQLVGFAAALSGRFPVKLCCNAPGCTSLDEFSELEAVGGKACMCSGCKTARYCCRACQESHWKVHKAACRALAAARQ
uniref:phytol kinase n=1 Tax=Tetradesmus obliquus TaxID=3088 RepID=A0A383W8R0_TETOB|eukprot:jgi/Sobl393_1/8645/SZX74027.1